jgi:hypothetical protein
VTAVPLIKVSLRGFYALSPLVGSKANLSMCLLYCIVLCDVLLLQLIKQPQPTTTRLTHAACTLRHMHTKHSASHPDTPATIASNVGTCTLPNLHNLASNTYAVASLGKSLVYIGALLLLRVYYCTIQLLMKKRTSSQTTAYWHAHGMNKS